MFFFRRKEVVIDCFTSIQKLKDSYPPKKASHFVPEWWKKIPNYTEEYMPQIDRTKPSATMKFCSGFRELYASGFVIPMWVDVRFYVNKENYYYAFASSNFMSEGHHPNQHGNNFQEWHHAKLISPWHFKEKTGVKFAFTEPFWSFHKVTTDVRIPPAVVSYDLQHATNVNILMKKREDEYSFTIEAGEPLVHLIPLSDKKIVVRPQVVTEQEMRVIMSAGVQLKFYKAYEEYKKIIKKTKERI